ncbi:hypothetical protein BC943DRAFT_330886 [Umbelopsis sp. AD052]|nr:hypothetical protein BC943DRAFT_330886 [Umbelopsis sp. AD052]
MKLKKSVAVGTSASVHGWAMVHVMMTLFAKIQLSSKSDAMTFISSFPGFSVKTRLVFISRRL